MKYFFFYFILLLGTYSFVDIIVNPAFRYPITTLRSNYSLLDAVRFIDAEFLRRFRDATIFTKLSVLSINALIAYWFSVVALRPLKRASEREKFFVANAAHELATPLSIIKSTAEVVRMKHYLLPSDHIVTFTNSVIEEVNRMSVVLKYFLHFAYPRKTPLPMTEINMTKVCLRVVQKLSRFATEKSVAIDILTRTPMRVWGNAVALEDMTIHLLRNSIIYSNPSGRISLSLTETSRAIEMRIVNEGKGIPDVDLPHIFDPFFRGINGAGEGHGFGLAIVQEIAKLHLAKVTAQNNERGVIFTVYLPK